MNRRGSKHYFIVKTNVVGELVDIETIECPLTETKSRKSPYTRTSLNVISLLTYPRVDEGESQCIRLVGRRPTTPSLILVVFAELARPKNCGSQ